MASYNGSIDLLALKGARLCSGINAKNPNQNFVCIPVDLNEIKIQESRATVPDGSPSGKYRAGLRVNIWPLSENYKNAARRSAQERGDANANIPTHELTLSFTPDFVKAIAKAMPALVQQVKDANKERDPEIVNQDPNDENSHLFKAIRNRMNSRLAMLYQPQAQPQQTAYPQTAQQVQAAAYVAPAEGTDPFSPDNYTSVDDSDLPF